MNEEQTKEHLNKLPNWVLKNSGKAITRNIVCKNFSAAVESINKIKDIAEYENHHPDLHLTGYKNLEIELSTHSVGHLTEADFNVAIKIEALI